MSFTTLASDLFSDTSGTDLTNHTPDSGFTDWVGTAGIIVISGNKARTNTAFNRRVTTAEDARPRATQYTVAGEITRADTLASGSVGGFCLSDDSNANVNNYKGFWFVPETTGSVGQTILRFKWVDNASGPAESKDADTLAAADWAQNTTKRCGVVVDGSNWTLWLEDTDGSNYTSYGPLSFAVKDAATYSNATGFGAVGLYCDQSGSTDQWFTDNFYLYDGAYLGVGGTPVPVLGSLSIVGADATPTYVNAGTLNDFIVTAFDDSGDTFTNYDGTVTFSQDDSSDATLPANFSFLTAWSGTTTINDGFGWTTRGIRSRLTVADTSRTTITAGSNISVWPGTPTNLAMTLSDDIVERQENFSSRVTVTDAYGNLTNLQIIITWAGPSGNTDTIASDYTIAAETNDGYTFTDEFALDSTGTSRLTATAWTFAAGMGGGSRSSFAITDDTIFVSGGWIPPSEETTVTYTQVSRTTQQWQQLSEFTDSSSGVDFDLTVKLQYPMVISTVNPAYLIESGDTGSP